jgi:hypothetical protein
MSSATWRGLDARSRPRPTEPVAALGSVASLVLVVSSSRSGSSLLLDLLQRHCEAAYVRGECAPFMRLAGLAHPESAMASDALLASHASRDRVRALGEAIGRECGWPLRNLPADRVESFAEDLWWRLGLQWPEVDFDRGVVRRALGRALNEVGWSPDRRLDLPSLHIALLRSLRARYDVIDPRRYDIERDAVKRAFPDLAGAVTAPPEVVEEPPFILAGAWVHASERDLEHRPLVLKSPSHAYRLAFWEAVLPAEQPRYLHLVRNPAAAINGLMDGWLSDGFHSHRPAARLDIDGYSDAWWKFDLPPGWEAYTEAELSDVCAFQWKAAHSAILDHLGADAHDDCGDRYLRVRFEDLQRGRAGRREVLETVADWMGVRLAPAEADDPRPQMATASPVPWRWRDRRASIEPIVRRPDIRALAAELGYAGPPDQWP